MLSIGKSMKTLAAQLLIIGMMALGLAGAGFGAGDLNGHWAAPQINAWISKGIITGYPDGTVRPDAQVTRAEFMAMVNKAYNLTGTSNGTFRDVSSNKWYTPVISAASAAGYIGGYPDGTMRPNGSISRFEAAIIIMKVSKLNSDAANNSYFSDNQSFPSWAQGAVGAAFRKGIMSGYPDGSFSGSKFISRAEAVVCLTKGVSDPGVEKPVVEAPVNKVYSDSGTFGTDATQTIKGNITIKASGVTLRNMVVEGNLTISKEVGNGDVTLKNVTIKGNTYVNGGGPDSVHLTNVVIGKAYVAKGIGTVRLVVAGTSVIDRVIAQSDLKLEESSLSGKGVVAVTIETNAVSGIDVELISSKLDSLEMNALGSTLSVDADSRITKVTVSAKDTQVKLLKGSTIATLVANAAVKVTGQGSVSRADINANGVTLEMKPGEINVKSGVTVPGNIGPTVQSFSPADGATKVAVDSNIVITFSKTMRMTDGTVLTNSNVDDLITFKTSNASGTKVGCGVTVTISSGKTVITVNPTANLSNNKAYYLSVEDLEDSDNKPLTGKHETVFTTVSDSVPKVESFSPANGSVNAALATNVVITFSEVVRKVAGNATLDNTNVDALVIFKKTNAGGAAVSFNASVATVGGKTVITVNPDANLINGQAYFVSVPGLEDSDNLALTGSFSATFTTVAAIADPAPIIESFSPANGSADIALGSNIVITFSETLRNLDNSPLENNTVDGRISLKTPGSTGTPVDFDATVTVSSGKTVITVNPANDLLPNTTYYAAVSGVEDSANQTVSGNATFTTEKVPADALSNLTVNIGSAGDGGAVSLGPAFAGGTTAYTATVVNGVGTVKVTPAAAAGNAAAVKMGSAVKADGICNLLVGSNSITVIVSKAGCNDMAYTITITREEPADVAAPSYQSGSAAVSDGNMKVAFTFSESLLSNATNAAALKNAVSVMADPAIVVPVYTVSLSGRKVVLDFESVLAVGTYSVTITGNTLKDSAGNIQSSDTEVTGITVGSL